MPSEAEDLLMTHSSVLQAHVVPVPDERMGEVGVAFLVLREGSNCQISELQSLCTERLARFKVPADIAIIAALPRNATGKVLKRELRLQFVGSKAPAIT
jgi:fatty-acyl-CoA synthase